jgi:putative aldouronate transport system substrate-binding protein
MKKGTLISVLCLFVAIIMVFAACKTKETTQETSEATKEKSTEAKVEDETPAEPEVVELSISRPNFGVDPVGTMVEDEWTNRMNEYLGVDLQITWDSVPWADYREREKIVLASGEYPDIFTNSYEDTVGEYGGEGLLLELSQYRDLMTNYQKYVDGTPNGEAQAFPNGVAYGFQDGMDNTANIEGSQSFTSFAYRFDIFEANDIKIPETLDEFYDAAKKLKEIYPDVYPINKSAQYFNIHRGINGIFHTYDTYFWDGTEWQYGPAQDNYKDMMKFIQKLYTEGLLDPAFVSDDNDTLTQKIVTDQVFMLPTIWAGSLSYWTNEDNPDMHWGQAFLPENPDYGTPWKWGSTKPGFTLQTRFQTVISAATEYPEICVKMIDYQYTDEMNLLMNWGFEDVTYKFDADGNKTYVDEILSADNVYLALADYGILASASCRPGIVWAPQNFEANIILNPKSTWYHDGETAELSYWLASDLYGGKDSIFPNDRAPAVSLTPDESTERSTIITACNTFANENAIKFITGELDVDADWDTYIQQLSAMGDYQSVLDMMNEKSK